MKSIHLTLLFLLRNIETISNDGQPLVVSHQPNPNLTENELNQMVNNGVNYANNDQMNSLQLGNYLQNSQKPEVLQDKQVYYSTPQIQHTQELIEKPQIETKIVNQPIITKRIISQPIIKQQIVQTPLIFRNEVQKPVYTEQITQPIQTENQIVNTPLPVAVPGNTTIRENYLQPINITKEQVLQVQKEDNQTINHPQIVRSIEYHEEVINKEYQAPDRQIYYQPIHEQKIINNQEQVNFVPQDDQLVSMKPITQQPVMRENSRVETIVKPGKEIFNQTFIQPIIQRENLRLNYERADDKHIQLDTINEKPVVSNVTRTENIQLPSNEIISQPITQKYYQQNNIYHVQNPIYDRISTQKAIPVPVPSLTKLNVQRQIPVPVPNKNAKGNTEVINETNVRVVGYEKSEEESESEDVCPNCRPQQFAGKRQMPNAFNAYAAASLINGGNKSFDQLMMMKNNQGGNNDGNFKYGSSFVY